MKDESEYRPQRHPRPVDPQLPPPGPQRPADGRVHAAGVQPRFRGQRAEHGADRPHHAGRLAAAQEPPRSPRPRPLRLGGPRVGHHRSPPWWARRSSIIAAIRRCTPRCRRCLKELHAEFGWKSRAWSAVGGRWVLRQVRKEEKRLAAGFSHEPPDVLRAERVGNATGRKCRLCRSAEPLAVPATALLPCRSSGYAGARAGIGGGVEARVRTRHLWAVSVRQRGETTEILGSWGGNDSAPYELKRARQSPLAARMSRARA